jgi:molybdate transport system substrate-binding protein
MLDRQRRGFVAAVLAMATSWDRAARAQPQSSGELVVFAAASLQNAFEAIGRRYRQQGGAAVRHSFASSGVLARQIEQGAPAAVFASADEQWMDYLAQRKLLAAGTRKRLLGNRLVLVVPAGNPVSVELAPGFDFAKLLGPDGRWATGDPGSVPVGRYAQDALTKLGAWDFAQTRLVRAENVRVALAFVERGEARAGVVYQTDAAVSSKVRVAGVFPADSHAPVAYPVAAIAKNDSPAGRAFLRFLEGADAREIFVRHGFAVH